MASPSPLPLHPDQLAWLRETTSKYQLADEHKALRIAVRYVMEEADLDRVFTMVRCANC
jgi:hypothetical protein